MLERIKELAAGIDAAWRARRYAKGCFDDIAYHYLSNSNIHKEFDLEEVFHWGLEHSAHPRQLDKRGAFGEPPLTLWASPHFVVDLYFWISPETSIHDHGFMGAFMNLRGTSLHCTYQFVGSQRIVPRLRLGELKLGGLKFLEPGMSQTIAGGSSFIHRTWHLSRPTVTLVVRTWGAREGFHTNTYYESGLQVFFPKHPAPFLHKQILLLRYLFRTRHAARYRLATELFLGPDLWRAFKCLRSYYHLLLQESDWDTTWERIDTLIQQLRDKHGAGVDCFREYLQLDDAERTIEWNKLVDEDHRFLAALLRTLRTREDIDEWLTRRYPTIEPSDAMGTWLGGMTRAGAFGLEISETHLLVLRLMLKGFSPEDIYTELTHRSDYAPAQAATAEQLCADIRETEVFRPLFTRS